MASDARWGVFTIHAHAEALSASTANYALASAAGPGVEAIDNDQVRQDRLSIQFYHRKREWDKWLRRAQDAISLTAEGRRRLRTARQVARVNKVFE